MHDSDKKNADHYTPGWLKSFGGKKFFFSLLLTLLSYVGLWKGLLTGTEFIIITLSLAGVYQASNTVLSIVHKAKAKEEA